MKFTNSKMVTGIMWSPNHSGIRTHPITKIAIHHMALISSAEDCGKIFFPEAGNASSNYGIGCGGEVWMYVEEKNRSWCTSSSWCDQRAVTIEVSNCETGGNWPVSDHVLDVLIDLCVDICIRNGIKDCSYTGDKDGVLQKHEWYTDKICPGPYLGAKFEFISHEVNKRLQVYELQQTSKKE